METAILGKRLRRNTLLLTASSLVMQCVGLWYRMWLTGRIGAAGMGLFQLVMSAGMLFTTLAVSGIRFATTRLLSEEAGAGRGGQLPRALRRCCMYALFFGLAAGTILFLCAEPIGFLWVRDARTVRSLRLMAPGLPAVSLSAVFCGYFTSVGHVWKTAVEAFIEQLCRIALTALLLSRCGTDIERCCAAVTLAGTICDLLSLAALALLCRIDRPGVPDSAPPAALTARMLRIALPLAMSAWARSALSTLRQLLVPRCLQRSGLTADTALAALGIIGGMALPLLIFPTAILSALAELLVPALTEAQVSGRAADIRAAVRSVLRKSALYSLAFTAFFFVSADALAALVCRDMRAAHYIRILAPMLPFLYIDIVTDGCLKGLGQMMRSMSYNLAEALLGLALVCLLLPSRGIAGYIAVLYVCECFNFTLSLLRLRRVTHLPVQRPQSSSSLNRISYPSSPGSRKLQSPPSSTAASSA